MNIRDNKLGLLRDTYNFYTYVPKQYIILMNIF